MGEMSQHLYVLEQIQEANLLFAGHPKFQTKEHLDRIREFDRYIRQVKAWDRPFERLTPAILSHAGVERRLWEMVETEPVYGTWSWSAVKSDFLAGKLELWAGFAEAPMIVGVRPLASCRNVVFAAGSWDEDVFLRILDLIEKDAAAEGKTISVVNAPSEWRTMLLRHGAGEAA